MKQPNVWELVLGVVLAGCSGETVISAETSGVVGGEASGGASAVAGDTSARPGVSVGGGGVAGRPAAGGQAGTSATTAGGGAAPLGGGGGTDAVNDGGQGGDATGGAGGTPLAGAAGEGGNPSTTIDDPAAGAYDERAALLAPNSEMAVAEVGGLIYVIGGYPASRETQATVQRYDPSTDEWAYVASHPTPIHHPVVVAYDGSLYSMGGQPDTDECFVYDPSLDDWDPIAPMPTARGAGAGAVIGTSIYVVGGRPPANNELEAYDVEADTWRQLAPLPRGIAQRNHLAAVAIGGKLYVAGGRYDGGGFSSPMTDSLDVYDPTSDSWSQLAPMLRPRGGVNGVVANGCFHVFGGEGSGIGEPNDVFPDHDVYDPGTDTWTALEPLPVPVHGVTGAAFVGGLIYIPGGGTTSGGTSGSTLHQVYRPNTSCQ